MKNTNFSRCVKLWVAALVLVCGVAFTGCKPGVDKPALPAGVKELSADSMLIGDWKSEYGEIFEITSDTLKNGGSWGDYYAGNNLLIREITQDSGYLYIKYTRAMNPDSLYSEDAADVGKWYALSYKNLKPDTVDLAGAYGNVSATNTIEEAIAEFTIENGYFATYSTCAKQ